MKNLKPIKGGPQGCLNCGYTHETLPLDMPIMAGFGSADIYKDKELVYSEKPNTKRFPLLKRFELMAQKDPDHDWRYKLDLPLRSAEYQRQGKGKWVLIKKGMGFA